LNLFVADPTEASSRKGRNRSRPSSFRDRTHLRGLDLNLPEDQFTSEGPNEYKEAIESLKRTRPPTTYKSSSQSTKRVVQDLENERKLSYEMDDWLDDDIGATKKKGIRRSNAFCDSSGLSKKRRVEDVDVETPSSVVSQYAGRTDDVLLRLHHSKFILFQMQSSPSQNLLFQLREVLRLKQRSLRLSKITPPSEHRPETQSRQAAK
jgi:hypothetical protein